VRVETPEICHVVASTAVASHARVRVER